MLSKCQLVLATGGTVAQDLTMQWSTLGGFMQELSLMVIDEGQQYGTDREIAVISLLRQTTPSPVDGRLRADARRYCSSSPQRQTISATPLSQKAWATQ